MNKVIFDTSALLAIINQEQGFEEIEQVLPYSSMSMLNICEVITVLTRNGIPQNEVDLIIEELIPEIIPFNYETASLAGNLINDTKAEGLSLGDRCCIATAIHLNREIYTTDKAWSKVKLDQNPKINLIRE